MSEGGRRNSEGGSRKSEGWSRKSEREENMLHSTYALNVDRSKPMTNCNIGSKVLE